jgi:hypothetical protein
MLILLPYIDYLTVWTRLYFYMRLLVFFAPLRWITMLVWLFVYSTGFSQQIVHRVYLIGDAGEPDFDKNGLHQYLQSIHASAIPSSMFFLGDNIYPKGMPLPGHSDRFEAEKILHQQVALATSAQSTAYFIPGNHDWKKGGRGGWDRIQQQQAWVDSLHNPRIQFLPKGGCPGPEELSITNELTVIIIDSQWFLHPWDKPLGEDSFCECKTPEDVAGRLYELLERNAHKQVMVLAHHPVISYGEHGGVYPWSDHVFPLRSVNKNLWIPLPGIGSIYPLYRKIIGNVQDIKHPLSRQYRKAVSGMLEKYPGIIYANGHEHTLQHSVKNSVHYVTSGSGAKQTYVRKKGYAQYVASAIGFATVDLLDDGSMKLTFHEVDKKSATHSATIPKRKTDNPDEPSGTIDFNTTKQVAASTRYEKGRGRLLGSNYRDEWKQVVSVPIFNIAREQGGLRVLQRGGGMQTLSLRLADSIGNEFTLRSIEKYPEKAVPEMLRGTFAQDLVQDQISAAHPYGALAVPRLAQAAGIYYTKPSLVFVPNDPALGHYRKDFSNTLALYEERPAGAAIDKPHFGNSEKIVSTDKVLEKLQEDNDNQIDQSFVLRSRIFSFVIGGRDRPDAQWRWASFDDKKGKRYRPIPRDRDQAFFASDGLLSTLWSRRWALPKFEGFHEQVRWTPGFMFNARYFDRTFLHELTREQWMKEAAFLNSALTDEIIDKAVTDLPVEVYPLHGEKIARIMKNRRDKLHHYATEHYSFLAREVDVPGSDKREWFSLVMKDNHDLEVTVSKLNKAGEVGKKLYQRTFSPAETNELRLFGRGGDDVFELISQDKSPIKIRIIGGEGKDSVVQQSRLRARIYDLNKGIGFSTRKKLKELLSNDPEVNAYNRKSFQYPRLAPLLYGNFNFDDGLFLGGGFLLTKHGFRKAPYKSQHLFLASHALLTESYDFTYKGVFNQVFGKWGLEIKGDVKAPNFVNNFFGWGNETEFNNELDDEPSLNLARSIDYYRLRTQQIEAQVMLTRSLGAHGYYKAGLAYQQAEIEQPKENNRFIATEFAPTQAQPFFESTNYFGGAVFQLGVNQVDNAVLPARGVKAEVQSSFLSGFTARSRNFTSHHGFVAFYQSFRLPARLTYAFRVGGGFNTGQYDIYNAQILDGKTELRGYRKTRFYGDSRMYINNELRLKLLSFRSYLFPASLGVNGFFDTGRVWYEDETGKDPSASDGTSRVWHKGLGGGIWFTPFSLAVVSTEFAHSQDGNMLYLRLGFLF